MKRIHWGVQIRFYPYIAKLSAQVLILLYVLIHMTCGGQSLSNRNMSGGDTPSDDPNLETATAPVPVSGTNLLSYENATSICAVETQLTSNAKSYISSCKAMILAVENDKQVLVTPTGIAEGVKISWNDPSQSSASLTVSCSVLKDGLEFTCNLDEQTSVTNFTLNVSEIKENGRSRSVSSTPPSLGSETHTVGLSQIEITISGTGFKSGASISIGTKTCKTTTFISSLSLKCIISDLVAGTYDILLDNGDYTTASLKNGIEIAQSTFTQALEAYYKFDDTSLDSLSGGADFADSIGSNHGLAVGATLVAGGLGKSGACVEFQSVGDYVSIPNSAAYQLGTGAFTIGFWAKYPQQNTNGYGYANIFSKTYATSPYTGMEVFAGNSTFSNSSKLLFRLDLNNYVESTTGGLDDDTWRYYNFVRSGNTLKIYINGNLDSSASISTIDVSNSIPLRIGSNANYDTQSFKGKIDELRFWSRALSDAEIAALLH